VDFPKNIEISELMVSLGEFRTSLSKEQAAKSALDNGL